MIKILNFLRKKKGTWLYHEIVFFVFFRDINDRCIWMQIILSDLKINYLKAEL